MTLSMLKLEPEMDRLARWARARNLLPQRGDDDLGYALHALLAAGFGALAPQPFALRDPKRPAVLLAYSGHDPAALREHAAAFAEPDTAEALRPERMAAKPMPDRFAAGARLGFALRARPTVRTDRDGNRTRAREVDAFLAAVEGTAPGAGPDRGTVYQAWLTQRLAAGGAATERLALDSFRLSDARRRGRDRVFHGQRGPDASFSGVLRVADPDAFAALLARGVGRHRAFGYGMVLLRPAA